MRFRSSTRVAKIVELYAAFTAVYVQTQTIADAVNEANARQAGSAFRDGSQREASPPTTGSSASPIANADADSMPSDHSRSFHDSVTTFHWCEWSPRTRFARISAPST